LGFRVLEIGDLAIHRPVIEAGKAPGGIWMRVCAFDRLLFEHPIFEGDRVTEIAVAVADAVLANGQTDPDEDVRMYFYDGDTGECIGTAIGPKQAPQEGIRRRRCSKCGEDLGWGEGDPCDRCKKAAKKKRPRKTASRTTKRLVS